MISFQNITKSFGTKTILHNVTGCFEKGKINMIIGASGTGKSVLIKCMVGIIQPDTGEVWFDKKKFFQAKKTAQIKIKQKIGMLFQSSALFDSKNVEENVQFPLDILTNIPIHEKRERVHNCLKRVGLENAYKKMPSELSGGMKKRVGIARAIINNPTYLFCDEPNSGLDPQTALIIDELIQSITYTQQTTTVIVTHDINSVMEIGNHIIFLHQGYNKWEGNVKDIFHADIAALNNFILAGKLARMVYSK